MKGTIDHVFFDLDRTLWDFDRNSKEALLEIFEDHRLGMKMLATAQEFLHVYETINERYWELFRKGSVDRPQLRQGRFADVLTHFGHPDIKLAEVIGEAYVNISPRKTALVDGALELLGHLAGQYELHIITNGFEEVQHIKLSASGLDSYFGEVITSERAGVRKPDVGIFRFAEQLTSADPERSVMIGDHFEADVQGAGSAGWQSIYYSPEGNRSGGHKHVRSLTEVMQLL